MECTEFTFRNFRNLISGRLFWEQGLNLLTGRNGSGKTNCIEGLHLLLGWGPFGDRRDLLSWNGGEKHAFLTGKFSGEEELFLALSLGGTSVVKSGGKRSSFPEIRLQVPALAFLPRDMNLMDGPPSGRRSFLDRLCALLYPLYARRLNDFRKAVRHRTILLRQGRNTAVTSRAMAPLAVWIWEARERAVSSLEEGVSELRDLLPAPLELSLRRGGAGRKADYSEDWWSSLVAERPRECRCCTPVVGPHRDDLHIGSGGRDAAVFFSRGQKRRASVALMIAAGRTVEARLRRKPILLLDEIASELDEEGRRYIVSTLERTGWQIIAAAAEGVDPWPGAVWSVAKGNITLEERKNPR